MTAPDDPRVGLLCDPQTCGGLLAAVPSDRAHDLLAALQAAGHRAAQVGLVTDGPVHLTVTTEA
jgi:selenide,water dikinase